MSDVQSSPTRGLNKITYAGRAKKKRRATLDPTYKDTGPNEEDTEEEEEVVVSPKQTRVEKMATRTPKKVDVHLPGPSPKRVPTESAEQMTSAKKPQSVRGKRGAHSRAGSVASLAREDTLNDVSPKKPASSAKPRSQIQRKDTPDDGADDVSSVGDPSKRARKSEAERRQFLEEDANSGDVEPHRVFCKTCKEWVELNPKLKFVMKNWLEHRKQCKNNAIEVPESPTNEKEAEEGEDDNASVTGSVLETPTTAIKRVKKEEDRKAIIEADPLSGEVRPDMVFCKGCKNWIRLQKDTRYSLSPWRNHSQRCSNAVPSTRVATAQRKLKLVNDLQMKSFTARNVDCKLCDARIELESKIDYDLTKWEEHKSACSSGRVPPPMKLGESGSPSVPRPPPSVASTEATVVATEATTPQKGTKRSREGDEDTPSRAVRPRGASYEPPQGDSPGFLGWMSTSIKNFFEGFRSTMSG